MKNKKWTAEEKELLRNLYGTMPTKELAQKFNRSVAAIQREATNQNLKISDEQYTQVTGKRRWTLEDDLFIKENYTFLKSEEIAKHLNRSGYSVRKRVQHLGLAKPQCKWTEDKENFLENSWGKKKVSTISKRLNISVDATIKKAKKMNLGSQDNASGEYLSIPDILNIIEMPSNTLYSHIKKGYIKVSKFHITKKTFRYRVSYSDFMEYLESHIESYAIKQESIFFLKAISVNVQTLSDNMQTTELPDWLKYKIKHNYRKNSKPIRPWSKKEELSLLDSYHEGLSINELSNKFNRSRNGIRCKLKKII